MLISKSVVQKLKDEIELLKDQRSDLRSQISKMNDIKKLIDDNSLCTFEIDFEKMNVVAIERFSDGTSGNTKTIVGYKTADGTIHEYNLFCNIDQHEILVKKFQEYIKGE